MTEEAYDLSKALVAMVPVLTGGLIAYLANLTLHFKQKKDAHERLLREKAEEIISSTYKCMAWLQELRLNSLYDKPMSQMWPPLDSVQAITFLYFPAAKNEYVNFAKNLTELTQLAKETALRTKQTSQSPETDRGEWEKKFATLGSAGDKFNKKIKELIKLPLQ